MKYVFANADDLGMCSGVDRGILESIKMGWVSSASLMACQPKEVISKTLGEVDPRYCIGAHLQLTDGLPCSARCEIPSLVRENGSFPRRRNELRDLAKNEIICEWHLQIEKLQELGTTLSFIDTHHHVHRIPVVAEAYCEIARHYGLSARSNDLTYSDWLRGQGVHCVDLCETEWCSVEQTFDSLKAGIVKAASRVMDGGCFELMCHPGIVDEELSLRSGYCSEREQELALFLNHEIKHELYQEGIMVVDRASVLAGSIEKAVIGDTSFKSNSQG